jgi:hypothetical protein
VAKDEMKILSFGSGREAEEMPHPQANSRSFRLIERSPVMSNHQDGLAPEN